MRDSLEPLEEGEGKSDSGGGGTRRPAPRCVPASPSDPGAEVPAPLGGSRGAAEVGWSVVVANGYDLLGRGGPLALAGDDGTELALDLEGNLGGTRLGFPCSDPSLPVGERCSADGVRNPRFWWYKRVLSAAAPSVERGGSAGDWGTGDRGGKVGLGVARAGRGGGERVTDRLDPKDSERRCI